MSVSNFFQFLHANSGASHRQFFGMSARSLTFAFVALCATVSCFTPEYHCRITCSPNGPRCPTNFTCDPGTNLCARDDQGKTCPAAPPVPDAGVDASIADGPAPDTDPADTAPHDTGPVEVGEPPSQLCYGGTCYDLSPEARKGLVLWLDPSTLPAVDTQVARWADRSGRGNDALALSPEGRPRSRGDGLRLEPVPGGALRILDAPSLNFDSDDFVILIVARLSPNPPSCLFTKSNFDRIDPRGILLEWAYSTPLQQTIFKPSVNKAVIETGRSGLGDLAPHLLVVRRSGDSIETRVDGAPAADVGTLSPAGQPVSNSSHAFIGGCGTTSPTISALHAVVAVRGTIPLTELVKLEGFLLTSFPR